MCTSLTSPPVPSQSSCTYNFTSTFHPPQNFHNTGTGYTLLDTLQTLLWTLYSSASNRLQLHSPFSLHVLMPATVGADRLQHDCGDYTHSVHCILPFCPVAKRGAKTVPFSFGKSPFSTVIGSPNPNFCISEL